MSSESVLYRWWFTAALVTVIFFTVYQILLIFDQKYSISPICPGSDEHYAPWFFFVNYSVCGAFGIIWIMLVLKITQTNLLPNQRVPYYATISLVSLGFIATVMALVWNWGGICVDVFGVASPAAIWGEWMSCGPLLLFITITIVNRPTLTRNDILIMISFFVSIAAGFILLFKQPIWLASIWLAISCIAYLPMFWLGVIANSDVSDNEQLARQIGADELQQFSELSAKKNNLCVTLIYILPAFTIVYFIAFFKVIDEPVTITCYQILSVLTKGLFAAVAMDAHLQLLDPATRALIEEKRANEARRAFLRFIFHEVRTPLNSLTMGIEILERCDKLDEAESESLLMMRDASSFMTETLNDVLSMQKIEEGKLELELSSFSIRDAISKVCFTLKGSSVAKGIAILRDISSEVPEKIIGDKFRIEHVLANILSNAVKFSPENSKIIIAVTCRPSSVILDGIDLTVTVTDQGQGISQENQKKLFTTFMQIRPGQMQQGQGSGLGLSLCKQIVTMHGGTISCQSVEGEGCTFTFTLPLQIGATDFDTTGGTTSITTSVTSTGQGEGRGKRGGTNEVKKMEQEEEMKGKERKNSNQLQSSVKLEGIYERLLLSSGEADEENGVAPPPTSNASTSLLNSAQEFKKSNNMTMTMATTNSRDKDTTTTTNNNNDRSINPLHKSAIGIALVVDDMRSNRKMLNILLSKSGVESEMAEDGIEAVSMVQKDLSRFQLIFMDNMMPRMNGVQAATVLRKLGYTGLIIGITGNVLDDDIRHYLEGGADMVLSKPLKMSQLDMILYHVREHGSQSIPDKKLVEECGRLYWK